MLMLILRMKRNIHNPRAHHGDPELERLQEPRINAPRAPQWPMARSSAEHLGAWNILAPGTGPQKNHTYGQGYLPFKGPATTKL